MVLWGREEKYSRQGRELGKAACVKTQVVFEDAEVQSWESRVEGCYWVGCGEAGT